MWVVGSPGLRPGLVCLAPSGLAALACGAPRPNEGRHGGLPLHWMGCRAEKAPNGRNIPARGNATGASCEGIPNNVVFEKIPGKKPHYNLRNAPMMVTDREFKDVFQLDEQMRPLEYVINDYQDKDDGTIVDRATGLTWQKSGSSDLLNYKDVQLYIDKLNRNRFAGYNDWRLPTVDELASLLEPEEKSGELFIDPIFDNQQKWCWSSDRRPSGGSWDVSFSSGNVGPVNTDNSNYVRAVCP